MVFPRADEPKRDRLEWSVNFRGRQSAFRQILYGVDSRVAEWQAFVNSEIRWEISKAAALRLAYSRSQRWVRQQGSSQARFDQDELSLSWEVLPLENLQVKGAAALHGFRRAGQSYDFYNEVSLMPVTNLMAAAGRSPFRAPIC